MEQTLHISLETIVKIFIVGFVFYILFLARNVVVWFFFALIISLLLDPAIAFLRWLRLPRFLAIVLVYLSIFLAIGLVVYLTAPVFIFEITQLSKHIPEYFDKINPLLKNLGVNLAENFQDFTSSLIVNLQEGSLSIVRAAAVFFGGISSTFFIFSLAFFISLQERGMEQVLSLLVPQKYEEQVVLLFEKAQVKVAGWFGARIVACLFVGVTSFFVFFLLGIPYSFTLALMNGVLNFVPYIGPTVALIVSVLFVGVSQSWLSALYTLIALVVIQEIENKALTPFLVKKFIDLPPVLVLLSLLVGGTIFGFLGTLFSVPVFGIIYEFLKEFLEKRKKEEPTTTLAE